MDKPISMSVKDYLIRTLAVKIMVSEKVIEAIVNHQFQSANEAMDLNNSIEISGFGKFYFNEKKAKRKIISLNNKKSIMEGFLADPNSTEQKKHASKVTLEKTEALLKLLNSKVTYED
jgi:nucleoid DNA-binding protein